MTDPIEADDGTLWLPYIDPGWWSGWQPGEDGVWIVSPTDMARENPEVLAEHARRQESSP